MRIQIDVMLFPVIITKKVGLGLTAKLTFLEMTIGEFITVVSSASDHLIEVGANSDFFGHFSVKRSNEVFAFIHSSLGKLPATFVIRPMTDEDLSILRFAKNSSNVGTVRSHKLRIKQGKDDSRDKAD